ncbi:MAG TPA: DUF192 domain-containing protein [Gemmatimonadales bacterium]|nr:DUF192 domain-containing protein [Gemmatimonadales bacterium]
MRWVEARNVDRGTVLGSRVGVADRWWLRLRGLSGRKSLEAGEGLLLDPCRAVHMFGMRFPIDVAFLSRDGSVVAVYPALAPGARTQYHRAARSALELPAGTLAATGTMPGDRIHCSVQETR